MPKYFLRLKIKYSSYQCKYLHHHHQSHHYRPILLTYTMFVLSYLYPLILCLIYSSPAQCFVAPPNKEDCSTVRCRPGRHFVFFHFHFIAIFVTRNKSKIFFMGRYTNCHP